MIPGDKNEPIPYARQSIDDSDIQAVVDVLKAEFVTQGPAVGRFESAISEVTGARYAIAVSSGTAALHVAYAALGLKAGDIGIAPSITFVATANALRHCGAEPVFCDVDPSSGLASAANFAETDSQLQSNGKRAKAYIPVSYSGRMADLQGISELASANGAYVVEDAAHSLGAVADGSRSGSCAHSDAAILSFHPVKHITSGEGGMVLTNDKTLAARARRYRSHGIAKPESVRDKEGGWAYAQTDLGWNYRLSDIQASLGISQLKRLDSFLVRRREIASAYIDAFSGPPFSDSFRCPEADPGSAWHLFVIRFPSNGNRRAAYEYLRSENISAQVHYMPVYRQPFYRELEPEGLPGAEAFYSGCLSLPLYSSLKDAEQTRVIDALRRFCEDQARV